MPMRFIVQQMRYAQLYKEIMDSPRRPRDMTFNEIREIVRLRKGGMGFSAIARAVKRDRYAVSVAYKKWGEMF